MKIEKVAIDSIKQYKNNPRKNDDAVDVVADSIEEFGFQNPIIIDSHNIIIAGNTRHKAAMKLGLTEVPILRAENLTDAQVKAFRIMDNKSSEYASWDWDLLRGEFEALRDLDFNIELTGFTKEAREIIDLPENLEEVPDVDLEGAIKRFNNVIVIIGMQCDEHEVAIRDFLNLPSNRKTMKSTEFMEIIKSKTKL